MGIITGHRMQLLPVQRLKDISWSELGVFWRFMQKRLEHARLQQVAGNLTFTTLLALVPLLTIALAIFSTFPQFGTLRASLEAYFNQIMMPRQIADTILRYLSIFTDKAAHLSVIGALGVVVGAVALMSMVENAFNQIWRIRTPRPFLHRAFLYLTIATLGPFILAVSLTMTSQLYLATGGSFRHPTFLQSVLNTLLSILWTTGAFSVLYVVIPNRTVHWREAVWGGLFAAIAFEIVKRLFAVFIVEFTTYRMIYGALAAVPIFLLWIYLSWLITLAGAAIAASVHYLWHERWKHEHTTGGAFLDAIDILRLLYLAGESSVDEYRLRKRTGFGLDEIGNLMRRMQAAGWVEPVRPDPLARFKEKQIRAHKSHHWKLAANPDELRLFDVFMLFAFDASADSPLARRVGEALEERLGETLSSYFSRHLDVVQ